MAGSACPVCGETIAPAPGRPCPACGALLPEALAQAAPSPALPADEPKENDAQGADGAADELLAAFRSQFEERRIRLPKSWIERLHRLALEVEPSRRQATILFIDLREYTRLTETLSAERLDALRQWFFEVCTRRVELHGGFIVQFLGDAALAAFGAPWAFERDSESALRAALEISGDVRARGTFDSHPLAVRAGADVGTVNVRVIDVQGQKRLDLFGSPVNLASRLEGRAETWEILASDTLAAHVRGIFQMELREEFHPKNYGRAVIPWSVKAHRELTAARRRQDLRLVGREAELAAVRGWLARALAGDSLTARILGEAGVGKTRLALEAFAELGPERANTAIVGCEPHDRHVLFGPMLRLLQQLASWAAPSLAGRTLTPEAQLSAFAARFSALDRAALPSLGYMLGVEPYLSQLRVLPGAALRAQTEAGLVALLGEAARMKPLVVFLDDSQWCDPLTFSVLRQLAEAAPAGFLLLIAGREAEGLEVPLPPSESIRLGPLGEEELLQLLGQIAEIGALHPLALRRLLRETEGLPLYVIELARALADAPPAAASGELPRSVVDVLQARLDQLDAGKRALLQCGSVLGRKFSYRMVSLFEAAREDLLAELYALKGLRMLREEPMPEQDVGFVFTPTMLRDLAYQMMTTEQQAALHGALAERIESAFADRMDQFLVEAAAHWTRAGRLDRARPYLRRAAQRALDTGVPHEAYDLLSRALEKLDAPETEGEPTPPILALQQRGLLHELAGKASRLMGDFPRSSGHFEAMGELAAAIGNPVWRARAFHQLALNAMDSGKPEESERLLAAMRKTAPEDPQLRARGSMLLGILRLRAGRLAEADESFSAATLPGGPDAAPSALQGDAWNNLGLVRFHEGNIGESGRAFREALRIWETLGNAFGRINSLSNLGMTAEKRGAFAEARALYARASALAEEAGYLHGITAIEANRANLALLAQDWKEAQTCAARSLHIARMLRHPNSESIALENLGLALAGLGMLEEALRHLENSQRVAAEIKEPARLDSALLSAAWVLLMGGKTERAAEAIGRASAPISPDLARWQSDIQAALDALAGKNGKRPWSEQDLYEAESSWNAEDYLRRLDLCILLAQRSLIPEAAEKLASRRQRYLGGRKES